MENKTDKVPTHLRLPAGSQGRKTLNKQVNKISAVWKIRSVNVTVTSGVSAGTVHTIPEEVTFMLRPKKQ